MTDAMGTFADVRARLAALPCPFCRYRTLELTLRCDVHPDRCLFLARCQSCRMQYLVDRDTAPVTSRGGSQADAMTTVRCARCGRQDCTVVFRCTVASRRCGYEITCPGCAESDGLRAELPAAVE